MGNTTRPAENSKKLPRGKPFQPGKTGNPGGRPRKTDEERTLEALCKEKTPEALETILQVMAKAQNERAKLAAAQYVLDRGWGKPKESIEHSGGVTLTIAEQIKQAHEQRKAG
jgi:hypothetical protein